MIYNIEFIRRLTCYQSDISFYFDFGHNKENEKHAVRIFAMPRI